jgi:hypothetical protein
MTTIPIWKMSVRVFWVGYSMSPSVAESMLTTRQAERYIALGQSIVY